MDRGGSGASHFDVLGSRIDRKCSGGGIFEGAGLLNIMEKAGSLNSLVRSSLYLIARKVLIREAVVSSPSEW